MILKLKISELTEWEEQIGEIIRCCTGALDLATKEMGSLINEKKTEIISDSCKNLNLYNIRNQFSTYFKSCVQKITFEKNKVSLLTQQPVEKELSRVNIELLQNYVDPLTSFIKLLSGISKSKTIDGRRIYILTLVEENKDKNIKTYGIKEYINIWTDHKRKDLEKISIISKPNSYIPEAIYIYFKRQVFRVLKD